LHALDAVRQLFGSAGSGGCLSNRGLQLDADLMPEFLRRSSFSMSASLFN
jgi:hypothetical protein